MHLKKTHSEQLDKIDRLSFKIAFGEAAIQPGKEYSFTIDVSEPGYIPTGVTAKNLGKDATIVLARATGAVIETLKDDPKVVYVRAPRPKRYLG